MFAGPYADDVPAEAPVRLHDRVRGEAEEPQATPQHEEVHQATGERTGYYPVQRLPVVLPDPVGYHAVGDEPQSVEAYRGQRAMAQGERRECEV
ncbi:hypothetical protein D3C76_1018330 [compost metagenome]